MYIHNQGDPPSPGHDLKWYKMVFICCILNMKCWIKNLKCVLCQVCTWCSRRARCFPLDLRVLMRAGDQRHQGTRPNAAPPTWLTHRDKNKPLCRQVNLCLAVCGVCDPVAFPRGLIHQLKQVPRIKTHEKLQPRKNSTTLTYSKRENNDSVFDQ